MSKYEYIIFASLQGAIYFFLLCLITIISFGFALLILDKTQGNMAIGDEVYATLTDKKMSSLAFDASFTQYLLMLGEFEILGNEAVLTYTAAAQRWIWILFIFATLMTNVVFFNTLVSVLGV